MFHNVKKILLLFAEQDSYLTRKFTTALCLLANRMSQEEKEMLLSMTYVSTDETNNVLEETEVYADWVILSVKAKPIPQALAAVHALAKFLKVSTKVTTKIKETYTSRRDLMLTTDETSLRMQKNILDAIMERANEK